MKIIVVGSTNTDMTAVVPSIPKPGETVIGSGYRVTPGGKGANQASACASQGTDTVFISALGNDSLGDDRIASLEKKGINTKYVVRKDTHSGVALIFVDESGENVIGVAPGANALLNTFDIDAAEKVFEKGDILLLQLEIPMETVVYAARKAKEHDMTVILNPAPIADIPDELLGYVDIITPNEHELAAINGGDISYMLDKGIKYIITTLGSKGVHVQNKDEEYYVPAFKVKAVDTVGAGDCYNGVLAAALSEGKSMKEALEWATAAAAVAVTREGAQDAMPTKEDTAEFLSRQIIV